MPILVSARLLKLLDSPQPNSVKYFATADVPELTKDRTWLGKMTNAVSHHWKQKNQRKAVNLRRGVEIGQPMEFSLPA